MSPRRTPAGGRIDRLRTIRFNFDGKPYTGHQGDTLASALLANGVSLTAFAQNLFDETYNAEFSPGGFVFRARPARYGFEVGYKF